MVTSSKDFMFIKAIIPRPAEVAACGRLKSYTCRFRVGLAAVARSPGQARQRGPGPDPRGTRKDELMPQVLEHHGLFASPGEGRIERADHAVLYEGGQEVAVS
jgi:hypothetical protein